MIAVGLFEEEMASLKDTYEHGCYEYGDSSGSFRKCTTLHFRQVKRQEKYGVYVVRHRDTGEVLYIGKSGTINSQGQFKGQDILRRLRGGKRGSDSADEWFGKLVQERGPLVIEYIFLSTSPSPAFVEAALLQAHLDEHHRLPYKNKSL